MRFSLVLILIVQFLITACISKKHKRFEEPQTSISKNLVVSEVAPKTFVVKDSSFYNSNVLVAKVSDETVVILSSPIETIRTQRMLKWIQNELNPKKNYKYQYAFSC